MKPGVPTISVVLMVKNESHQLSGFFKNIEGVADEVVLVDTGSTDGTVEKARSLAETFSFPVRVLTYIKPKFHDGATRQFAVSQCKEEYVLQVDADERLSDEFKKRVREFLKKEHPEVASIPRIDELVPHLRDIMPNRLFRRLGSAHFSEEDTPGAAVHAEFIFEGTPTPFPYPIEHIQGANHWLRKPHRIFDQLSREIERVPNTVGFWRELWRGIAGFYYKFRKTYYQQGTYQDGATGKKYALLKGLYVFLFHLFIGLKPRDKK